MSGPLKEAYGVFRSVWHGAPGGTSRYKKESLFLLLLMLPAALQAEWVSFPSWGFFIDLPEEYELSDGDMKSTYTFVSAAGPMVSLKVYPAGAYRSAEDLAETIRKQLNNRGETEVFEYRNKKAVMLELDFSLGNAAVSGFGLCLELDGGSASGTPFLLALAYGDKADRGIAVLHLSCLDAIAPNAGSLRAPGPITAYSFPRGGRKTAALAGGAGEALFFEHDAEAAQFVVDREDLVLRRYVQTPLWKEAWERFYRIIYRDSFERVQNAAFVLERSWSGSAPDARALADKALKWVQDFKYERDLEGSDFVNLVTAAAEGRGDCDSRALLWAVILEHANIPAGIIVSAEYGHAMGIVDAEGAGARFPMDGTRWLVAETTAHVDIGMIGQSMSDTNKWLGFRFE
ncbi:MAG: hypothetical protein LBB61_09230 [Treponema sp.]|jgi:hypothetical protein|nr:hypothetical protein [Treponema sp.]